VSQPNAAPRARPTRVQLLVTCLVDSFFPDVGFSVVAVLERLGLQVDVPPGQTCCGQPAFNSGSWHDARAMARHLIDVFGDGDVPVIVPSGSCGDMVIHQAPDLLRDDAEYGPRAKALAARTHEFTQFVVDVLGVTDVSARGSGRVAYHPACHGLRGLGLDRQPKQLLDRVTGIERCPLDDEETCCGFGGLFAVKMSEISGSLLDRKIATIERSGADTVVATDVSCLMHIGGGLHRQGKPVQVKHLAEILAMKNEE
jgi:L-lactate dehydrogenase complex protein LldE